jgi:citronellol/citronellal dehydrogenase
VQQTYRRQLIEEAGDLAPLLIGAVGAGVRSTGDGLSTLGSEDPAPLSSAVSDRSPARRLPEARSLHSRRQARETAAQLVQRRLRSAQVETPSADSQRIFAPGIFRDRVAIITGGGSGIGLATAMELVRLGAKVAICGRTAAKLDAAKEQIEQIAGGSGTGDAVLALPCDIREPDQVEAMVRGVIEAFGRIDVLVNNAGGQFPSPAQHISPNGFLAVVKNNLVGTFHVCREVANRWMIPQKSGRIVNVIANIYRGFPGMVHTGAARAGVENMTMTLAVEWAQFGILVNAVAPGVIRSSGTAQYPPQLLERAIAQTPLKRAGTCEETAAAIVFLASPAAQFITGATLRMDGGQALWGSIWEIP